MGKGNSALEIAYINDAYAELLRQRGKIAPAIEILKRAAEIMELNKGKDFPDLDRPLWRLGLVYEQANRLPEAAACFKRAADVRMAVSPHDTSAAQNLQHYRRIKLMISREKNSF
jgi:tetratricopeptide (TPR) repeat protein